MRRFEGALVNAPLEVGGRRIAVIVRELRSRVVITHGPFGEYEHRDHQWLQRATVDAFPIAGDANLSARRGV